MCVKGGGGGHTWVDPVHSKKKNKKITFVCVEGGGIEVETGNRID